MNEYSFAFVVEGGATFGNDEWSDALFAAGCDDATAGVSNGRQLIHFDREARSFLQAVKTARRDIDRAKLGIRILGIDGVGMVTQAQIAENIGRSRQYVNQLVSGTRGGGTFPPPAQVLGRGKQLWHWIDVAAWLHQQGIMDDAVYSQAVESEILNTIFSQQKQQRMAPREYQAVLKAI